MHLVIFNNFSFFILGWLCKIKLSNPDEFKELLDKQKYEEWCNSESH